jgi:hypothetical protein
MRPTERQARDETGQVGRRVTAQPAEVVREAKAHSRTTPLGRRRPALSKSQTEKLLALLSYAAVAILLFGLPVLANPSEQYVGWGTDPGAHVWFLAWWPHALSTGTNPVITNAVWAPSGYNLAWATAMPGPSIIMWPITATFGPVVAYNILSLLAPTLSAWTAYLLCRRLTGAHWPSFLGGYLFGFSSYELGHLMGHPNLALVFLAPLCVLLVLRRLQDEGGPRLFVLVLSLAIFSQLLISTEILFTLTVFGVLTYGLAFLVWWESKRKALLHTGLLIGIAYAVAAIPASPFLYYLAQGSPGSPIYSFYPSLFSSDILNFVIPTAITRLGQEDFASVAATFTGNVSEQVAYLGVPLLLLLLLYAATHWRDRGARFLLLSIAVVSLFSLGPRLHVAGVETIALPWRAVAELPLFRYALPARFTVYVFLAVGVVVALWLSDSGRAQSAPSVGRPARWILALLGIVFILPNLSFPFWRSTVDTPSFFRSGLYRQYLAPGENVLVVPYGDRGNSMLWQAETGFYFRMPQGYVSVTPPPEFAGFSILETLYSGDLISNHADELRAFLQAHRISAIIVVRGTPGPWRELFSPTDPSPIEVADVLLYRLSLL